jgi:hypothetical protein
VGYTRRPFRDSDVAEFLSLYETTFGKRRSEEWFDWKYCHPPYVDHVPVVVSESRSGDVVGVRAFLPLEMYCGSTRHTCLQPADAMVHPDHRRRGLFTSMTREAIDRYSGSDVRMFFNFPNEKSWRGSEKLDWRAVSEHSTYYRVSNSTSLLGPDTVLADVGSMAASTAVNSGQRLIDQATDRFVEPGITARRSRTDPSSLSELSEFHDRWRPRRCHAVRDETFYEWRLSNPAREYAVYFGYRDDGLEGALVTGSNERDDGIVLTSIVDVLPLLAVDADRDVLLALLKRAIADNPRTNVFKLPPGPVPPRVASYCGFVRDDVYPFSEAATPTLHAVRSLNESWEIDTLAIDDPRSWCITLLEKDTE